MKSGKSSSEFYLALFPMAAGLVLTVIGALTHNDSLTTTGSALMGGTSAIYGIGRSLVKRNRGD